MIVFVYGDSITLGLWDEGGGWVDRLKAKIFENEIASNLKNYNEVYNLGIDGNFTWQIIERFDSETKARLWPDEKYMFIFATGTNDTLHKNGRDFVSSPEKYTENLKVILEKAKKYTERIYFVNLTPVDEVRTNPLPPEISSSGKCYSNDRIDAFNEVLDRFCRENNMSCIKVNEKFKQMDYPRLLTDGLHPNTEGHKVIFDEVVKVVKIAE